MTHFQDDDVELNVLGYLVDILGTNCDQCVCMVQCCFTSTETIRLIRTGTLPGSFIVHQSSVIAGVIIVSACVIIPYPISQASPGPAMDLRNYTVSKHGA